MHETIGLTNCQNCGTQLDQKAKAGRPRRNCSSSCREQHRQKNKTKPKLDLTCQNCQVVFESSFERRFCSQPCRLEKTQIEQKARRDKLRRKDVDSDGYITKPCGWCKEPRTYEYRQGGHNAFHPNCTIEARRARYRIKTVKRHSLIRKPSRLAADEVVRTYGNSCAVCSETIDLTLQRTSKMGLTVDHWIPLSKGGSDDMSNLRPAHWICNRRKSNSLPKETNA
jgi:5-methylcytosine-specific restriction endonuclease McrA